MKNCPCCNRPLPERSIGETLDALRKHCTDNALTVFPGDRVREDTAAVLLGRSVCTLRNWRSIGGPVQAYRTGRGRGRVTYDLKDIAGHLNQNDETFTGVTESHRD